MSIDIMDMRILGMQSVEIEVHDLPQTPSLVRHRSEYISPMRVDNASLYSRTSKLIMEILFVRPKRQQ